MRATVTPMNAPGPARVGVLSGLAVLSVAAVFGQDPPYRAFTVADGLPSNTVYSCAQDKTGLLWFTTDAGVARFDGTRFERFSTANGMSDNEVLDIFHDSAGRTWLLTLNGKLCFYQNGRFHDERDHPELALIRPESGFASIAETPSGTLWFGGLWIPLMSWTNGTVHTWSPGTGCPGGELKNGIPLLVHAPGQAPWLVFNSSLYRMDADGPRFVRCWNASIEGYPIASVSGAGLLAMGPSGLTRCTEAGDTLLCPTHVLGPQVAWRTWRTPRATTNGTIWVPSNRNGVAAVDLAGRLEHRVLNGLNVHSVYEDSEGNLWLNTNGQGTIRIDPWQQGIGIFRSSPDDPNVTAVLATRNGDIYYGTDKGAIARIRNGRSSPVLVHDARTSGYERVHDLQEDGAGRIWFATDRRAGFLEPARPDATPTICKYRDERTRAQSMFGSVGLKAIAPGPEGKVVGSFFGIAELTDTLGHPTFITRSRYWRSAHRMYAPFIDREGGVWFETNAALHCFRNGARSDLGLGNGAFGSRITDVDQLPDGTMVIGTAGNGVVLLRNDRIFRRFGRAEGVPGDEVRAAVVRGNALLVATDAGACSIEDPTGLARIRTWNELQGLDGLDIKDIDRADSLILLATPSGLYTVPERTLPLQRPAPRIAGITAVVNDSVALKAPRMQVRAGDRVVLRIHGVHFSMPERMRFAMRMEPDISWSATDPEILMNMPPSGEHDLWFRAQVPGSPWGEAVKLHLSVIPPWYQRTASRIMAVLVLAAGVVAAMRWRSRVQGRRHRAQMERQLALQEERQRIASDMHDDIGADISHLLMMTRQYAGSATLHRSDRSHFTSIEQAANGLLQKIDEVIWSLAPQDDHLHDALSYIQRYAETFAEAHGMAFRTLPLPTLPEVSLHSQHRREVYLIVKEVLHNIAKHTSARNLRFVVLLRSGTLHIRIEDDGAPRPPANGGRNGHGKANLKQRTDRIGALLRHEPLAPIGTALTIELPLNRIHHE